jgi:hypothetical protein
MTGVFEAIPTERRAAISGAAAALLLVPLSACGSDRFTTARIESHDNVRTGLVAPAALAPVARPEMVGRWTLTSSDGSCVMNFGGVPGETEGTISPEGGCPGGMFTSRRWTFEQNTVVIRDHNGEVLARVAGIGAARLDGQSLNGDAISLTR